MLLCSAGWLAAVPVQAAGREKLAVPAEPGLVKGIERTSTDMARADTALRRLHSEYSEHRRSGARSLFKPSSTSLIFIKGFVLIESMARLDGGKLEQDLRNLGIRNSDRYGLAVAGLLPAAAIEAAAALPSLRSISAAHRPIRNVGAVTTQGDIALRANIARGTYGVDGSGVNVAVLSDSYDQSDIFPITTAAGDIATGDLPAGNPVVPGGEYPGCGGLFAACTDEGRAMLQIIHDVAPGANLMFHTALDNQVKFANAITTLASLGADVIVDDLAYPTEPMFMDGIIAQAVDTVEAAGVSYFSAAGNAGRESYESAFVDSGDFQCIEIFVDGVCDPIFELVGQLHDFDPGPGIDTYQGINVPVLSSVTIALQWEDPFGNVHTGDGPLRDHDILLMNSDGSIYLEISGNDNVLNGSPVEALSYLNLGTYGESLSIAITYDGVDSNGPPSGFLKTVIYGDSGVFLTEHLTSSSTVVGHANAIGAKTVGAAYFGDTPAYGQTPPLLEPYSSAGGTPILFDTNGDALGAPELRDKPDFTSVDGGSTTFFLSPDSNGDGFPDFFGTSAAAPHAAAVAALMLEANPGLTPSKIATALRSSAINMAGPGFDFDSGYGLIQADAAIAMALSTTNDPDGLTATAISASRIDLAWNDNSANEDGFDIERSPSGAGTWALAGQAAADATAWPDSGLGAGTAYDYRVKATNAGGFDSAYSGVASATTFESCLAGPQAIPSAQWHGFSLPCSASPDNAVTEVFPGLAPGDYDNTWVVHRYNAATQSYETLGAGDPIGQSVGYWIISDVSTNLSVNGFVFPNADIPLVTNAVDGRLNLLGNHRNGDVPWADVTVIDGISELTLDQADPLDMGMLQCDQAPPGPDCRMSRIMYQWNGAAYQVFDGITPGLEGTLSPFESFWVRAFKPGIELRIPPAVPPPPPGSIPAQGKDGRSIRAVEDGSWQIRLIAESSGKSDPGNVLGRIATGFDARDAHDLEEIAPFGDSFLSIIFNNPGFEKVAWGFTSDIRSLTKKPSGEWPFVVKASDDVGEVTLRWEGDPTILGVAWLVDQETGEWIRTSPGGSYSYTNGPVDRRFKFAILSR
jgi:hypothetical protein